MLTPAIWSTLESSTFCIFSEDSVLRMSVHWDCNNPPSSLVGAPKICCPWDSTYQDEKWIFYYFSFLKWLVFLLFFVFTITVHWCLLTCFWSESIRNTRYSEEQNKKLNNTITNIDTIVDFVSWLSKFPLLPFLVPVDNDDPLPFRAELMSPGNTSPIV